MSASIAATADSTASRAAISPRIAADKPLIPSLACNAFAIKVELSARGKRMPNTTARPRIWFSSVTRWPTSFLRAMINERMACAWSDFTRTHPQKKSAAGKLLREFCLGSIFDFFNSIVQTRKSG